MSDGYVCKFRCDGCGKETEFVVRYREQDEDLIAWMESAVRPAMGAAHLRASPLCTSGAADLKMPINEAADGIGKRTRN